MTLIGDSLDYLTEELTLAAGESVIYRRGGSQVTLSAILGKTEAEVITDQDITIPFTSKDFVFKVADLLISSEPILPQKGDYILQSDTGEINDFWHQVLIDPAGQYFKYENDRRMCRVFTKLIKHIRDLIDNPNFESNSTWPAASSLYQYSENVATIKAPTFPGTTIFGPINPLTAVDGKKFTATIVVKSKNSTVLFGTGYGSDTELIVGENTIDFTPTNNSSYTPLLALTATVGGDAQTEISKFSVKESFVE